MAIQRKGNRVRKKIEVCGKWISRTWKEKGWETLAVLLCLTVLCVFVSMKQGFHMDELLSFELANAEFNPWIVTTQPEGRLAKFVHNEIDGDTLGETFDNLLDTVQDVLKNRGNSKLLTYQADVYPEPVWITAEQFADYIQVDGGDAFNYLSVYFNVKDDNHPPLHFMLLHTVSSLFKGRAEAWMGGLINLGAVAIVLALLIRLGRLMTEQLGIGEYARPAGIVCAMLYGLSAGAVATTLLIRMYGLLTLWCVAWFYLVLKKWLDKEYDRRNSLLILVTILGFWTQYFFLFYCILLAALVYVLLIRAKRVQEFKGFVRSMVISAVVGVALFPFAISDVFSSGRGVEALNNLSEGFAGYGTRLWEFIKILGSRTFFPAFWLLLVILIISVLLFGKGKAMTGRDKIPAGRRLLVWMLVLPPLGYFLLAARMSPYLVDRYMMPVFPFVILVGVLALFGLLKALKTRRGRQDRRAILVVCGLALFSQMIGLVRYDGSYLYQDYGLQVRIAEEHAEYPCICVYDGVRYYENLPEFTYYEKSLLLTFDELKNRQDRSSIQELDAVAVLIKSGLDTDTFAEVLKIFEEQYGFVQESWGWRGPGAHGDILIFMRKDV